MSNYSVQCQGNWYDPQVDTATNKVLLFCQIVTKLFRLCHTQEILKRSWNICHVRIVSRKIIIFVLIRPLQFNFASSGYRNVFVFSWYYNIAYLCSRTQYIGRNNMRQDRTFYLRSLDFLYIFSGPSSKINL